jgi:hypothetical protein
VDKNTVRGTYETIIALPASIRLHNPRLKLPLPSSTALAGAEVELVTELARKAV